MYYTKKLPKILSQTPHTSYSYRPLSPCNTLKNCISLIEDKTDVCSKDLTKHHKRKKPILWWWSSFSNIRKSLSRKGFPTKCEPLEIGEHNLTWLWYEIFVQSLAWQPKVNTSNAFRLLDFKFIIQVYKIVRVMSLSKYLWPNSRCQVYSSGFYDY